MQLMSRSVRNELMGHAGSCRYTWEELICKPCGTDGETDGRTQCSSCGRGRIYRHYVHIDWTRSDILHQIKHIPRDFPKRGGTLHVPGTFAVQRSFAAGGPLLPKNRTIPLHVWRVPHSRMHCHDSVITAAKTASLEKISQSSLYF